MSSTPSFPLPAIKCHLAHIRDLALQATAPTRAHSAPLAPKELRALQIHCLRLCHLANLALSAYCDNLKRLNGPPVRLLPQNPQKALHAKYLPILLSIQQFTATQDIPLAHWFRAQFDLLKPPPKCTHIPITVCHGPNAHIRYLDWSRRQPKRYVHSDDRAQALDTSFLEQLKQTLIAEHQNLVQLLSSSAGLAFPSVELVLWDLFPNISGWYLVAHTGFRQKFLESGACSAGSLLEHFQQYKRDAAVRHTCEQALLIAMDSYGDLPCIPKTSELG